MMHPMRIFPHPFGVRWRGHRFPTRQPKLPRVAALLRRLKAVAQPPHSKPVDEVSDAINRAIDDIGDQTDDFVAAAARRVLEERGGKRHSQ